VTEGESTAGDDSGAADDASGEATAGVSAGEATAGTAGATDTGDASATDSSYDGGSTGADASERAFRINSLVLADPHVYFDPIGDLTVVLNDQFAQWLTPPADGGSGDLEAGLVLVFRPLDQSEGGGGAFEYWNSSCPLETNAQICTPLDATLGYSSTYESFPLGPCLAADPSHLDPDLDAPLGPEQNCFLNAPFNVVIIAGGVTLPFDLAELSAQYVGDPSGNLVEGLLRGFLSNETANMTNTDLPPLGNVSLADLLQNADRDEDGSGWWLHLEFTALAVDWQP
jgi:hypothetical protein